MKIRTLLLLTAAASLLVLATGCELIVNFDRNEIDSSMMTADTGMPDTGAADACTSCVDSGSDSGDNDSGMMDAAVDSGADAALDAAMDATMDGADDDSGT